MLQISPSRPNVVSIPAEDVIHSLDILSENCWNLTACAHRTPNTNFFVKNGEFVKKVLNFLPFNTGCSENVPLQVRKNKPHQRKALSVGQFLHCVQTYESDYKNVFLQLDRAPSKHEPPLPYTVAAVTIFWSFVQTFLEQFMSREIFCDFCPQINII
jgi:hypothetical protein